MPAIMIGEATTEQIRWITSGSCDYGYDWLIVTMVDDEKENLSEHSPTTQMD